MPLDMVGIRGMEGDGGLYIYAYIRIVVIRGEGKLCVTTGDCLFGRPAWKDGISSILASFLHFHVKKNNIIIIH